MGKLLHGMLFSFALAFGSVASAQEPAAQGAATAATGTLVVNIKEFTQTEVRSNTSSEAAWIQGFANQYVDYPMP